MDTLHEIDRLTAENARLRAEVERLTAERDDLEYHDCAIFQSLLAASDARYESTEDALTDAHDRIGELQADVERLRAENDVLTRERERRKRDAILEGRCREEGVR